MTKRNVLVGSGVFVITLALVALLGGVSAMITSEDWAGAAGYYPPEVIEAEVDNCDRVALFCFGFAFFFGAGGGFLLGEAGKSKEVV